jgi:membrane-associated protease RseP (regulator of RpoE activity)
MIKSDGRLMILPVLVLTLVVCTGATTYAETQAYLGVVLQPLTIDLKEAMDVDRDMRGVLISDVVDESPADEYGLDDGDIIIEIDGEEIRTVSGATRTIKSYSPGDEVKIVVVRDGNKKKVIQVRLGERQGKAHDYDYDYEYEYKLPDVTRAFKRVGEAWEGQGYLGIRIENISEELGEYFGVGEDDGVLVLEVIDDSPAEDAGLQAGDVILEIDGKKMSSTDKLVKYISGSDPGEDVDITYKRKRRARTVEVELGEKEGPTQMFGNLFHGLGKCDKRCHTEHGKHHCWIEKGPGGDKIKVMEVPGKGRKIIRIGGDLDDLDDLEEIEDLEGLKKLSVLKGLEGDIEVYHMDMEDLQEELEDLREEIEELKDEIRKLRE